MSSYFSLEYIPDLFYKLDQFAYRVQSRRSISEDIS